MRIKKINVEFEEVKVVSITLDLGNDLENYMSKFLALKNHERNTDEILEVKGFNGSNSLNVVILIDEDEDEAEEVKKCKGYIEQFGEIESYEIQTAWILDDTYWDGLSSKFDDAEWYVYGKR